MSTIRLTPLEIEILLHYHVNAAPFPRSSQHIDDCINAFVKHGILEKKMLAGATKVLPVFPAMDAYIEALRNVPLPVKMQVWKIPNVLPT